MKSFAQITAYSYLLWDVIIKVNRATFISKITSSEGDL